MPLYCTILSFNPPNYVFECFEIPEIQQVKVQSKIPMAPKLLANLTHSWAFITRNLPRGKTESAVCSV